MIVVLDLHGVVVSLPAEKPVKLLGARLVSEYRGAGLSYALTCPEEPEHEQQVLRDLKLPYVPWVSPENLKDWGDPAGVYVSRDEVKGLHGWRTVTFDPEWDFTTLVDRIWSADRCPA